MWNITNQQQDAMTLTDVNQQQYNLPGQGAVEVNAAITTIEYHRLRYHLPPTAIWPFPDNQNLVAFYNQPNVYIKNQQTQVEAVYVWSGP